MSNSPSIQEILNAVKKSGYLMEQEVASVLENDGFIVATNSAFPDTDKEISREVDILARKMVYENDTYNIKVFIELICECKNNQNPFVFISRKKNKVDFRRDPKEFYFPIKEYAIAVPDKPNTVTLVPVFSYWGLQDSHYYYRTDSKAVQFCRILRKGKEWEAGHADVYNSIFFLFS